MPLCSALLYTEEALSASEGTPFHGTSKGSISRTSEKYTMNVQLVGLQIKE